MKKRYTVYYWFQSKTLKNRIFWALTKDLSIKEYNLIGIGTIESSENNINNILEKIFQQNSLEDKNDNMLLIYEGTIYPMSMGDIIIINDRCYWCDAVGWKDITKELYNNFKEQNNE